MTEWLRMCVTGIFVGLSAILVAVGGPAAADDRSQIEALLKTYERALNAGETDKILKLYTDDGVFMPQHSMPQIGRAGVAAAYRNVFRSIKLAVSFKIDEIRVIGGRWAFARTRSSGITQINATGARVPENNQELFILTKHDGGWKIARYIFSTTNPRR